MTIKASRFYFGAVISYARAVGYRLPWTAYVNGHFIAADTLAGIKYGIREELGRVTHA